MKLIAHRGNIDGALPDLENTPNYIFESLRQGFDCEIDVWFKDNRWYLGHDQPDDIIPFKFLQMPGLWCHCKNFEALIKLRETPEIFSVWIDVDLFPLTSNGFVWTHTSVSKPEYLNPTHSIAIMPDIHEGWDIKAASRYCAGVCSDIIGSYVLEEEEGE